MAVPSYLGVLWIEDFFFRIGQERMNWCGLRSMASTSKIFLFARMTRHVWLGPRRVLTGTQRPAPCAR